MQRRISEGLRLSWARRRAEGKGKKGRGGRAGRSGLLDERQVRLRFGRGSQAKREGLVMSTLLTMLSDAYHNLWRVALITSPAWLVWAFCMIARLLDREERRKDEARGFEVGEREEDR